MVLGTVKVYAKSSFSQKVPLAGALRVSLMTGGMNQWSFRINPNDKIDIDPKKTLSAPILRKGKIMEPDFLTKLTQATTATHVAIFTAISGLIMPVISLADITYSTT